MKNAPTLAAAHEQHPALQIPTRRPATPLRSITLTWSEEEAPDEGGDGA